MRSRSFTGLTALVAVASVTAGCSAANSGGSSPTPPLQMRLVTSSAEGRCSAAPLTSEGAGSACDRAGTTTYTLGASLGVLTPTSVTRDTQDRQTVRAELDKADASKLGDVTGKALKKQLAILLDGKVLAAPVVMDHLATGDVSFAFETAAEAEKVATELGASPTP